jgi:ketosteroid isomerase-like protein
MDELLGLEREGWEALCDATGADFYGRVMTDDALMVMANGAVMDRQAVVDALGQSPPWAGFELQDAKIVPAGDAAASLVYRAKAFRADDAPPFECVMTSVYAKSGDEWRLTLYQQTPIPDGN